MHRLVFIAAALVVGVVLGGLGAVAWSRAGYAGSDCSNRTLDGNYGYAVQGGFFDPTGKEVGDLAAAGQVIFDGNGHFTGTQSQSFNGQSFPSTFTATYTLNPDCTGTAIEHILATGTLEHDRFIAVDGGRQLMFVSTDPGTVLSGVIVKQ